MSSNRPRQSDAIGEFGFNTFETVSWTQDALRVHFFYERMKSMDLKLSTPWDIQVAKIRKLFEGDPDVGIAYDRDMITLRLFVDGEMKADAIEKILPSRYEFGNVVLKVLVLPGNEKDDFDVLIENAMVGNPHFSGVERVRPEGSVQTFRYAMFKPEIAQMWIDNLGDPHGNITMTYEQLAREVLGEKDGILYSTESVEE